MLQLQGEAFKWLCFRGINSYPLWCKQHDILTFDCDIGPRTSLFIFKIPDFIHRRFSHFVSKAFQKICVLSSATIYLPKARVLFFFSFPKKSKQFHSKLILLHHCNRIICNQPGTLYIHKLFIYNTCFGQLAILRDNTNIYVMVLRIFPWYYCYPSLRLMSKNMLDCQ
jgi:hypothetical protein